MTYFRSSLQKIGDQAASVYSSIDISDNNAQYYDSYIIPHDDTLRTSLILGMDASGKRADLILLIVSTDKSVTIYTLPRDTLVKLSPFSSKVCKLSEVMALSGERNRELSLVHALNLNYGLHVDNITELQFQAIPIGIDQLFGTVNVNLSDVEVAGLNQCAADTAQKCNGDVKDFCILDTEGNVKFAEELTWLCEPGNFTKLTDENGVPVDEDGNPEKDRCEQLYKINELIDTYDAPFDHLSEEAKTYQLTGSQLLSCLRKRHCYSSQALARSQQAGILLTELAPRFIQANSLDSNSGNIRSFCSFCAENGYLRTSYHDFSELESDLITPLRPIAFGKILDGVKYTDIPYWDLNYGAVLEGKYISVREMTAELIYEKEAIT